MITEIEKTMNEAQSKGWAKGCLSVAMMRLVDFLENHGVGLDYYFGWLQENN